MIRQNVLSHEETQKSIKEAYNQADGDGSGKQDMLVLFVLAALAPEGADEESRELATIPEIQSVADAMHTVERLPGWTGGPLNKRETREWFEMAILSQLTKAHIDYILAAMASGEFTRRWKTEDRYDDKKVRAIFWGY